jgi:hydrogenase maturation protease
MSTLPPTLFIAGIGNTLRRDDGIGPYVVQAITALPLQLADTSFPIDLNVEWLEILSRFEVVILVDANADGAGEVQLAKVDPLSYQTTRSSHYLDPGTIAVVIGELFSSRTQLYTCSVPGADFSVGEGLSETGKANADEAIRILRQWLLEKGYLSGQDG